MSDIASKLDIELYIDGCNDLVVQDSTDYETLSNVYLSVEFFTNKDNDKVINDMTTLTYTLNNETDTSYSFENDGLYYYHKMIIPPLSLFSSGNTYVNISQEFYYLPDDANVYYCTLTDNQIYTYNDIVSNSEIYDNYQNIFNAINDENYFITQSINSYELSVFSTKNIKQQLFKIQQESLIQNTKRISKDKKQKQDYDRDFLLSAVYSLDYLIKSESFNEAQFIIDNLLNCVHTKKLCDCG